MLPEMPSYKDKQNRLLKLWEEVQTDSKEGFIDSDSEEESKPVRPK